MAKKVFVSYCHAQEQWVWERLVPILRAAGCADVLVDRERFRAGRGIKGQMDATQNQADVSLLVLSPDYLASEFCRHEMDRAIAADPTFRDGKVLPVMRVACDLSRFRQGNDPPLWVDLTNDSDPAPWALMLKSLDATRLSAAAPHWLDVRDEIVRKLRDQQQSVNLVVHGLPNWHALRDHLRQDWLPRLPKRLWPGSTSMAPWNTRSWPVPAAPDCCSTVAGASANPLSCATWKGSCRSR